MVDRRAGRGEAAARLFAEMKQRWPEDAEGWMLAAESRLRYAFLALGQKDSARAIVEKLAADNPTNARYCTLADSLR